jgi:hypothetical protein
MDFFVLSRTLQNAKSRRDTLRHDELLRAVHQGLRRIALSDTLAGDQLGAVGLPLPLRLSEGVSEVIGFPPKTAKSSLKQSHLNSKRLTGAI